MRPRQIVIALNLALDAQQPIMLHGQPGAGKSSVVRQVAEQRKCGLIDIRLSQLDPVDLRGVPSVNAKKQSTVWNTPDFLPQEARDGKTGIFFLDEINSAAQGTLAAAYQLILDRRLGDYILPDGWTCIAAGNRATDRAMVNQMSTALKNRFAHLNFDVNVDDWCSWALTAGIDTSIIGFLRFRPSALNEFEARSQSKEEKDRIMRLKDAQAFATPRSWEFLSRIVKQKPEAEIEHEVYSGIVGEGVAAEYLGYLKCYRNMPNLEQILLNPKGAPVPEKKEVATLYAVATGLAARAAEDNFDRVVTYALRLPTEFQVLLVNDSVAREPKVCGTPAFQQWATKNMDVML